MKKNTKIFIFWLILVVAWNFGYPDAAALYDVCAAIFLSLLTTLLHDKF